MKYNTIKKKCFSLLTAAVLAGSILTAQVQPVFAASPIVPAEEEKKEDKFIFDTITIDEPDKLENIRFPETKLGTYKWVDPEYVPEKDGEDCEAVLEPDKEKMEEASSLKGWDKESKTVKGYFTIRITSLAESESEDGEIQGPEADQTDAETMESETEAAEENVENAGPAAPDQTEQEDLPLPEITVDQETALPEYKPEEIPVQGQEDAGEKVPDTIINPEVMIGTVFDTAALAADERPAQADEGLSEEEQQAIAAVNHTCDEISVRGENLPWYVQFRVASGEEYSFSNQQQADIFVAFEFLLWDTQKDEEYSIPDGEFVTVSMKVPAGFDYNIEHLLPNGATESIIPTVDGDVLTFSTNCFSPFGIAGSTTIVGGAGLEQNYPTATPAPQPTKAPAAPVTGEVQGPIHQPTQTPAATIAPTAAPTKAPTKAPADNQAITPQPTKAPAQASATVPRAVQTGDNTQIILFVVIAVLALLLIIAVVLYLILKNR